MFEMTPQQKQAFSDATNGLSAVAFEHFFLFFLGVVATVWLFLIFLGTIGSKKKSVFESLAEVSWAIAIYIVVGVVIYFAIRFT